MTKYNLVSVEEDRPVSKGAGRAQGMWRGHQKSPSSSYSAWISLSQLGWCWGLAPSHDRDFPGQRCLGVKCQKYRGHENNSTDLRG